MTLTEIAQRIDKHLRRFEADPAINVVKRGYQTYWHAGAYRAGSYVSIAYISYQGTANLKRPEAEAYLSWLDAGNVGRHFEPLS